MSLPAIGLWLRTSSRHAREVAEGCVRQAALMGGCRVSVLHLDRERPWTLEERPSVDGFVADRHDRAGRAWLAGLGLPVVVTSLGDDDLPTVAVDDGAVADLVAAHLRGRGFRSLGLAGLDYSFWRARSDRLRMLAPGLGLSVETLELGWAGSGGPSAEARFAHLADRLRGLPPPAVVVAANDHAAWHVAECCRRHGLAIPGDLALVGADDEPVLRHLFPCSLTTIDTAGLAVGAAAARLLLRLLAGAPPPGRPLLVPPGGLLARQSSARAVADPALAAALHCCRTRACEGIGVAALARAAGLPRRTLEARCRRLLGRSPGELLTELRLERARALLAETALPIAAVARRSGVGSARQLQRLLKARDGASPGGLRRQRSVPTHARSFPSPGPHRPDGMLAP